MITNDGKNIIAKFLLGQAPDFASYIAGGSGAIPLTTSASVAIDENKKSMDFEMFRVPIESKGFIKEDGEEKLVLKAEMPTDQRYVISEIAFFPSANNQVAGNYDSKILSSFVPSENWVYVKNGTPTTISYVTTAIDNDNASQNINASFSSSVAFFVNSNQTIFNNINRKTRKERPRFYNRALLVNGNSSNINSNFVVSASASSSIENSNISFDLGQNLPDDEIKIAVSLISSDSGNNGLPEAVRIILEFVNNSAPGTPKARTTKSLVAADFTGTRYAIITKKISEFVVDNDFSWSSINLTKLYCSVIDSGSPTDDFFVVIDGMRLENLTAENPIYGMAGYDIIRTSDGQPIIKEENSTNYVEYRFGIEVT
jgi:hypothetical protein